MNNNEYLDFLKGNNGNNHLNEFLDPLDIMIFLKNGLKSQSFWDRATPGGKAVLVIGGATLAAMIATAGTKIYKNYLSKIARKCNNAPNKEECMQKARAEAKKFRIKQLQKAKDTCKKSKDPAKCESRVDKEIMKLRG
jgi:hypothetical protein